jgi:hypothetical protein
VRPTGSLGASGRRREARRGARGRCGAIALGKGLEHGLHTISTTYLALAAVTSMPSMLAGLVVERAGRVGCVVCAGRERKEGACLMMMRRTTDGKASLAGQSKANQSTQHRSKAAQWDRHNSRVHTRLAGHREAREGIQKPLDPRRAFHALANAAHTSCVSNLIAIVHVVLLSSLCRAGT